MKELVDQLKRNRTLSPEELRLLLTDASPEEREYLHRAAREVARVHFGNGVFVRGLIEISNYCRNDCRYCGIRRSNRLAERYRLTPKPYWPAAKRATGWDSGHSYFRAEKTRL